ncbi:AraC family transcriptional regulator [Amycolatopsis saalfeldensis]|nr:AraC family transcriptional regulator [Amycolatopsis saalfeldensis]
MDPLAALLDGPRAHGAFLLRSVLRPPWSLRIEDRAPLTLVALVTGDAWIVPDHGTPSRLVAGDVAIVRGPEPYLFADDPATPPQAVILPGQECRTPDGGHLTDLVDTGVRTWGSPADGKARDAAGAGTSARATAEASPQTSGGTSAETNTGTGAQASGGTSGETNTRTSGEATRTDGGTNPETVLLTGTYPAVGEVSRRLLAALPHVLVVRADEWDSPLVPLLAEEIGRDVPGQEAVLDRLLDLLLIAALRTWFARPDAAAPAWYRAHEDAVVGQALRLLQDRPDRPWTVAALAAGTGVSRAALARRFTGTVGEPPMAYLAAWRLALAADLLRQQPDTTIGAIARQVGYGSSFALSAAFKREYGRSPQQYRARVPA